MKTEAPA